MALLKKGENRENQDKGCLAEQGRHSGRQARRHSPTAGARMNTPAIRCRTPREPPQEQSFTEQTVSEDGESGRRGRISGKYEAGELRLSLQERNS